MRRFMEEFSDSEPVAIIRGVVYGLRGDKAAGNELEEIVADTLSAELHKQLGIKVMKVDKNLHLHKGSENGEIDLAFYCEGNVIFLVEVKKTIDKKKITRFINNNVRLFIASKATPNDGKIYGVIAYSNSRGDAISFAKERGLLVCRITENGLEIIEPASIQQLCDLRSTCLDKPKPQHKHRKKKLDAPNIPHEWISYSKIAMGQHPLSRLQSARQSHVEIT